MNTPIRRRLGACAVILALLALPALALAGIPLVTMGSAYYIDTGTTRHSLQLHWSVIVIGCVALVGVAMLLIPVRKDPADPDV